MTARLEWQLDDLTRRILVIAESVVVVLVVKNLPDNSGDLRDTGWIHLSRRSPGGRHATHLSILAWRIPWTGETGRVRSIGLHRVRHNRSDLTVAADRL